MNQTMLDAHFIVAWLVIICALVFSWTTLGRRVMVAVTGLQILVGLIVAAVLHPPNPLIALHILGAVAAMVAYIFARRTGEKPEQRVLSIVLSAVGVLLVAATFSVGLTIARGTF
ncbi:MAG TPA: hypothetical protein VMV73_03565 [Candidatus Dormibacteraeota bacterium]|nr:hypothetical protein [Candidatus Dormibacteraeota bacterium]